MFIIFRCDSISWDLKYDIPTQNIQIYKYANYAEYAPYINYAKYDTFPKTVDMMELKYITCNHISLFGDKKIKHLL